MKKLILALVAMFGRKPRMVELIEDGALAYVRSWQAPSHRRQRARSLQTLQQLLRDGGDVVEARRAHDDLRTMITIVSSEVGRRSGRRDGVGQAVEERAQGFNARLFWRPPERKPRAEEERRRRKKERHRRKKEKAAREAAALSF